VFSYANLDISLSDKSILSLLFVYLSVCLSVSSLAYLKNHTSKFHLIFFTCYLSSWLGPPLIADSYILPVLLMTSCFHILVRMGQNQKQHKVSSSCQVAAYRAKSAICDYILLFLPKKMQSETADVAFAIAT